MWKQMENTDMQDQFIDVLEKNMPILLKISRAYTNLSQDRDDLISEITFQLWKSFSGFKEKSKVSTWIYRVALNTSMNYKRKEKSNPLSFSLKDSDDKDIFSWVIVEPDNSPELDILYQSIDELNDLNKAIILLYLDGNSHDDISEIMGISRTNAGTRIARIKDQLKKIINKES